MTAVTWVALIVGLLLAACFMFWLMGEISATRKHKRHIELMGLGIRPEDIHRHTREDNL